ncbi:UNVERIFIED_CONTAM: hypothetical protein NCL1_37401 [Trichonephila clavipes]
MPHEDHRISSMLRLVVEDAKKIISKCHFSTQSCHPCSTSYNSATGPFSVFASVASLGIALSRQTVFRRLHNIHLYSRRRKIECHKSHHPKELIYSVLKVTSIKHHNNKSICSLPMSFEFVFTTISQGYGSGIRSQVLNISERDRPAQTTILQCSHLGKTGCR